MNPTTDALRVQIGKENTWGTRAAATARLALMDSCTINPDTQVASFKKMGSLSPARRTAVKSRSAKASLSGTASYEQIGYMLEALFGIANPTEESGTYTRGYAAPDNSQPDPRFLSIEYGDGVVGGPNYGMTGGIVSKLVLSTKAGDVTTFKADLLGKAAQSVTLTAGIEEPAEITPIMAGDWSVSIDPAGVEAGTTPLTATITNLELTIDTQRSLRGGVGSFTPKAWSGKAWKGSLKMTLEFEAQAKAMLDAVLADGLIQRVIRLNATNGNNALTVDFSGSTTQAPAIVTNDGGTITVDFNFEGIVDLTMDNWLVCELVNAIATL